MRLRRQRDTCRDPRRTGSPGGQSRGSRRKLASSHVLVLGSLFTGLANGYINSARITPDGSAVTIFTAHSGPRSDTTSVLQASAATGEVVRVLYRINTGDGFSYRYFNIDPSGRFMILNTGTACRSVNGWVHHGRLIPLKPQDGAARGTRPGKNPAACRCR